MHRAEVDIGSEDGAHDLGFFLVDRQGARVILRRLVAKRHSAPHPHALGLGGRNLVADALARHLALELGEGQEHVQCQAAHAVVVLKAWVTLTKLTRRRSKISIMRAKSANDRVRRSIL